MLILPDSLPGLSRVSAEFQCPQKNLGNEERLFPCEMAPLASGTHFQLFSILVIDKAASLLDDLQVVSISRG